MIPTLFAFLRREVPGPKGLVLSMSLLAALGQGGLLATLNAAVEARASGPWQADLLLQFLAFLGVYLLASYFTMYKATEMVGSMAHRLRLRICGKLAGTPLRVVELYGHGEIYVHITRDLDRLSSVALGAVPALHAAVLLIFCVGYVGWLSPWAMLAMMSAIGLGVGVYLLQEKQANDHLHLASRAEAAFFDSVDDQLAGFKEIKLNTPRRLRLLSGQREVSDRFRRHYARTRLLFFISFLCSHSFLYVAIAVVALLPADWFVAETTAHFKMLTAILFSIDPIRGVVEFIEPCNHGAVSLDRLRRLEALLDHAAEPAPEGAVLATGSAPGRRIRLDAVRMRYSDPRHDVHFDVGPLDFEAEPGRITFVIGGNGSGKSSLLKLLAGLYAPDSGVVSMDGQPVTTDRIGSFRENITAVFADFHLFRKLYGYETADPARVGALLERFGLAEKTAFVDGGFSPLDLSTGQRKRLALLTALLEDRPVLVLDEFAADQDPAFRAFFYRELLPDLRRQGRTVVAATHDDAFFDCCDRIVKMDMGRIVAARP